MLLTTLSGTNTQELKDLIQKEYKGISFEEKKRTYDEKNPRLVNKIEITANIVAEKYFDDGIAVRIVAYKSGTCHVFMVFDKLDPTYENLTMINEYNDHSSFLSAYISQKNGGKYLELHGSSMDAPDEQALASTVCFFINELLNDSLLKYLQPITRNTYSD
jgi:hypothetical protein